MPTITLPHNWKPRPYQLPVLKYLDNGGKRAVSIWHRRAGKDECAARHISKAAFQKVGNYWHMLPVATQARKAIWQAVNPHTGMRRIDEWFPRDIRKATREQEMQIEFVNGSTYQLLGSDNYNNAVGSMPVGVVLSEWALADPQAWAFIRPILLENNGWAWFITTPRGRNHALTTYELAQESPEWFAERLGAPNTGVFTTAQLENEQKEYEREYGPDLGRSLFRQEYLCEFEGAVIGAYYAHLIDQAEKESRITRVPHDPALDVCTYWDLGIGDATAVWFVQYKGRECRIIEYLEARGRGLDWFARELRQRPYVYREHVWPHDGEARELGTGVTRQETAQNLGLKPLRILPRQNIEDGISAVRSILPMCVFDKVACGPGLEALRNYRSEWDEKRKTLKGHPVHDWSSHGADAFRYFAIGHRKETIDRQRPRTERKSSWMSL